MEDTPLLREYARTGSEQVFAQLVHRHIDWVYGVCRRRLKDPAMADDATQAVFIVLARKAKTMPPQTILAGWLLATAKYACADTIKREARRRRHEQKAAEMKPEMDAASAHSLSHELSVELDDALARLPGEDRAAMVMRFYQGRSFEQVGASLGVSTEAAKKRVSRSLERMRKMLGSRIAVVSAAGVAGALAASSAQAAPIGLAEATIAAASSGKACTALVIAKDVINLMAWAKAKLVAAIVAVAVLLGVGTMVLVNRESPPVVVNVPTVAPVPLTAPAPAAAPPPVAPPVVVTPTAPVAIVPPPPVAVVDDSIILTADPNFRREIPRKYLRFNLENNANEKFRLVVPIFGVPNSTAPGVEVVVERDGIDAALLVRSGSGNAYLFASHGFLVMLDAAQPGGLIMVEDVNPTLRLTGFEKPRPDGLLTDFSLEITDKPAQIQIDLASLLDTMQQATSARNYDATRNSIKFASSHNGGTVMLSNVSAPVEIPISQFSITETIRLAVGVKEIAIGARADVRMAHLDREAFEKLGLPIRHVQHTAGPWVMMPSSGFWNAAKTMDASKKFTGLLQRAGRNAVTIPTTSAPNNSATRPVFP